MWGARFGGTLTWADAADPPSIGVHHITRAWYTDCQPEKRVQVPRRSRCTGENRRLTAASYA